MNSRKPAPFLQQKLSKLDKEQRLKSESSQLSATYSRLYKTASQNNNQPSSHEEVSGKDNSGKTAKEKASDLTSLKENDSAASGQSQDPGTSSSINSTQSYKSKSNKIQGQGIEKYSAHNLNTVLGTVTKGQPMKASQLHYLVGFLNELTLLQPAVIQYNLKTLQDQGALTNDVLFYMMRLLMKSSYRWGPKQMSVLLTTLYTLDKSKDCQKMCDPRHTLKKKVKDLNPSEIKFMQDTLNNDHNMTPQRFLYYTAFLENLSNQNKKQSTDYIKALKSRGVFTTKSIAILMKFMETTRTHWRAIKYEKLLNVFGKEGEKFKVLENKLKYSPKSSLLSSSKSPKQIVHHQDTQDFCEVMDYFTKGGPLNAQKLLSVDKFLNNLSEMDDEELFEYLMTLKRRQVIDNDRCVYLKSLLQTHLVVQDSDKRHMLQKTLNRFMDQSKFQYSQHTYPSIRKYRLEVESKRRSSLSTVNSELEEEFSKASSLEALGSSNRMVKTYPVVTNLSPQLSDSRYIFLPKMSNKTKLKLQRAYDRLKVEIYLTKRLKYYQKLFRS